MQHNQLAVDPNEIIYAVRMSVMLAAKLPRLLPYGWQFHPGAPPTVPAQFFLQSILRYMVYRWILTTRPVYNSKVTSVGMGWGASKKHQAGDRERLLRVDV